MDILFISEINYLAILDSPYLGQLALCEIAEEAGFRAKTLHFRQFVTEHSIDEKKHSLEDTLHILSEYICNINPKIISFYCVCDTFTATARLAQIIKESAPYITIIFAGPHAAALGSIILQKLTFVDIVAYTEGEKVIIPLLISIINEDSLDNIPGIMYRKNKRLYINQEPSLLTPSELHNVFVKNFADRTIHPKDEIFIEGGRGCPFSCSFCSTSMFWERKSRLKRVDHIISEIKYYHNKYGSSVFGIIHDLFTVNKKHILSFCEEVIKLDFPITWTCSSRADTLDEESISMMSRAGCIAIFIGLETGSPRMQQIINKNLDLEYARNIILLANKYKIKPTVSFIYGFVDETLSDFSDTVNYIEDLFLSSIYNLQLHLFTPYPNTIETKKIQHSLYVNEEMEGIPSIQGLLIDENAKKFIAAFPEMFSAFYTFHSDIRDSFGDFYHLVELLAISGSLYRFSLSYIIKEYGLIDIYKRIIPDIYQYKQKLKNVEVNSNQYNIIVNDFAKLIINKYSIDFPDLIRKMLHLEFTFAMVVNSEKKVYSIIKTDINFIKSRENIKIEKDLEINYYFFYSDNNFGQVSISSDEKGVLIRKDILENNGYHYIVPDFDSKERIEFYEV